MKSFSYTLVLVLVSAMVAACASQDPQSRAATSVANGLDQQQIAAFCGRPGSEEASQAYSEAVAAELRRRESTGVSVTKAIADMRSQYCNGDRGLER